MGVNHGLDEGYQQPDAAAAGWVDEQTPPAPIGDRRLENVVDERVQEGMTGLDELAPDRGRTAVTLEAKRLVAARGTRPAAGPVR